MHDSNEMVPTEKLFYRPIEAAIRWCNLNAHETKILKASWDSSEQIINVFPQWPCLHSNVEKILDAVRNRELPYGVFGVTVRPGTPVEPKLLTIRHSDLKQWMFHYHPDQRPSFLFHGVAANQEAIHPRTYLILQADRDASQILLKSAEAELQALKNELAAAGLERENLRMIAENKKLLSDQSKASYLNAIGALVDTMLGSSESGRRHSIFDSQSAIVDSIISHYSGVPGLSKRSLDDKFAAGRRSLSQK